MKGKRAIHFSKLSGLSLALISVANLTGCFDRAVSRVKTGEIPAESAEGLVNQSASTHGDFGGTAGRCLLKVSVERAGSTASTCSQIQSCQNVNSVIGDRIHFTVLSQVSLKDQGYVATLTDAMGQTPRWATRPNSLGNEVENVDGFHYLDRYTYDLTDTYSVPEDEVERRYGTIDPIVQQWEAVQLSLSNGVNTVNCEWEFIKMDYSDISCDFKMDKNEYALGEAPEFKVNTNRKGLYVWWTLTQMTDSGRQIAYKFVDRAAPVPDHRWIFAPPPPRTVFDWVLTPVTESGTTVPFKFWEGRVSWTDPREYTMKTEAFKPENVGTWQATVKLTGYSDYNQQNDHHFVCGPMAQVFKVNGSPSNPNPPAPDPGPSTRPSDPPRPPFGT